MWECVRKNCLQMQLTGVTSSHSVLQVATLIVGNNNSSVGGITESVCSFFVTINTFYSKSNIWWETPIDIFTLPRHPFTLSSIMQQSTRPTTAHVQWTVTTDQQCHFLVDLFSNNKLITKMCHVTTQLVTEILHFIHFKVLKWPMQLIYKV